jgi:hypothetical protein
MSDHDVSAIASWERNERAPNPGGHAQPYVCTGCDWTGRGETALRHYRATGHAIRGKHWPAGWPDCQWSREVLVSLCAWCPETAERTAALKRQGREVSHTICASCLEQFEARR